MYIVCAFCRSTNSVNINKQLKSEEREKTEELKKERTNEIKWNHFWTI